MIEAAGAQTTFEMAWKIARPNAIIAVVAMYESPQILPLPQMYGKILYLKPEESMLFIAKSSSGIYPKAELILIFLFPKR